MQWTLVEQQEAQRTWDRTLVGFADCNVYQSFKWGEFRRRASGVVPYRWVATNEMGEIKALFQGFLIRRVQGLGIVVGEGGPVGDLNVSLPPLREAILSSLELSHCYCRVYLKRPYQVMDALRLKTCGWQRTLCTFSSGWSLSLDLTQEKEETLANFNKNYRRNLKKGLKTGFSIQSWTYPEPSQIFSLYSQMESLKNLERQFEEEEVQKLLEVFGDDIILYRCTDQFGTTLSLRGCVTVGPRALDWFAATSKEGRRVASSYALFWELLQACKERGIELYDLNGIDPYNNPGVYDFKRGTGAQPLEYLGEWEWATSEPLRLLMNCSRSGRAALTTTIQKIKNLVPVR